MKLYSRNWRENVSLGEFIHYGFIIDYQLIIGFTGTDHNITDRWLVSAVIRLIRWINDQ